MYDSFDSRNTADGVSYESVNVFGIVLYHLMSWEPQILKTARTLTWGGSVT